jgi:uncharacterized protein (TIGR04552 family)
VRRDVLEIDTAVSALFEAKAVDRVDVEAVSLLLSGGSVIDWQRVAFGDLEAVDRFLAMHLLAIDDPSDRERLRYVFNEAVSYLEEHLHLRFPADLRNPGDVREVFLWASQDGGFRRRQILSCVILKLMHVIHHMEAADLKFKTPLSEERMFDLAEARILRQGRAMRDSGLPIVSFYGSRKTRSSIITKLLAKKENLAATIFDKLRFRIVVERPEHLLPVLVHMTREMFPFNYAIPGQSHNNLLPPSLVRASLPVDGTPGQEQPVQQSTGKNEFSGASYRMINFIVDYPILLPDLGGAPFGFELGRVVYEMVEFQILDEETARDNEAGENSHHLYKGRQAEVVARRLKRGALGRKPTLQ